MITDSNPNNLYQIGGCLPVNASSYVEREADTELFDWVLAGEFCYVLNSRQMGKSSLRVRAMKKLEEVGFACAAIDITLLGTQEITPEKWYGGLIKSLIYSFGLEEKFNLKNWWQERKKISPVQCFSEFIEHVLLKEITQPIALFIDEIDSVLSLKFKDDFFALIRACYNKKAELASYQRLSFILLGVATPSDLIKDEKRTPFNIGRAVELNGFKLDEAKPLAKGLEKKCCDSKKLLTEILAWTGGQPFLTQKLCQLVREYEEYIPVNSEREWVNQLVETHVIDNWESQDEPEHLKTIFDRLSSKDRRVGRWLGLYQTILQEGEIVADDRPEVIELRLSGLVKKSEGKLKVYNPIYGEIFNEAWVEQTFAQVRPYAEKIKLWIDSKGKDKSQLLLGDELQEALSWSSDKSLSDLDYQFLSASQELAKRSIQIALDAEREAKLFLKEAENKAKLALNKEKEANQRLVDAQKKTKRQIILGSAVLIFALIGSVVAVTIAGQANHKLKTANSELKSTKSEREQINSELEDAKQEVVKSKQDKNTAYNNLKQTEENLNRVRQEIKIYNNDLKQAQSNIKNLSQKTSLAEAEVENAKRKQRSAQVKLEESEKKAQIAAQRANSLEQKSEEANRELETANRQLEVAEQKTQEAAQRVNLLEREAETVKNELLTAQAELEEQEKKFTVLEQDVHRANNEFLAAQERLEEVNTELALKDSQLQEYSEVIQGVQTNLATILQLDNSEKIDYKNKIQETYDILQNLQDNSDNLSTEIQDLLAEGIKLYQQGRYTEAIAILEPGIEITDKSKDKKAQGKILNNIGLTYTALGDYSISIDYLQQSLAIAQEIGDRRGEAGSLNSLGIVYQSLGEYVKAIEFQQQSLAIAQEIGDKQWEVASLNNLGITYSNLGDYQKAIDYHSQSLAIARETGDRWGEANSLNNLGIAYRNLGDYPKAIDFQLQSLAIAREIGDRRGEAHSLGNLGIAYSNLGDYPKAIEYQQQSLAIAKEIGDRRGEAASLNNLGEAYLNLGNYYQAIEYQQQSLAIDREIGNKQGEAHSLGNLGEAYLNLGDYYQAIEYQQQFLAIAREIGDRRGEAASLNNLGNAYSNLGDYPKAIEYQQQSLAIDREIGNLLGQGNSLNNLGATFFSNNQLDQAKTHLYQAINIYENIRELIGSNQDAWKVSIFDTQASSYRTLQQVLIAQNQPQKALEISERGRNRALIDLLLARSSGELPKIPTVADIQTIAEQQNATLVEYSIVDDEIYIWVIKPTGEITFRSQDINLPEGTTLTDLVQFSRYDIGVRGKGKQGNSTTKTEGNNRLQKLHQLLIAPIADLLPQDESERVIFIPHQELFLVPFAALQDEKGKYLIENHTILSAPSVQSLSFTREHWQRVKNLTGNPLIVGNPTMPTDKVGKDQVTLDPLPGAETEAEFIANLLNTQAIIGDDATEAQIRAKMKDADLIHLATHSLIDGINGIGSPGVIALTPDSNHDGWLESQEIMDEFGKPETPLLKAKLVVLSACDTGRGEIRGEGVVGLSRSLIAAGVPSLVVSLWTVPDDYTADLMELFYTNLYTEKMDKATAMREAMLAMISGEYGNSDPIAWAGFTLMGEIDGF